MRPTHATWPDARRAAEAGALAVLPFGAHEQHGPHLPLATDTTMAAGLAERVAAGIGAFALPPVAYGATATNDGFPGTCSLSFDTVRAVAGDLWRAARRTGFAGLVVVNGDYGNRAPLAAAAGEAGAAGYPVLVVDYPGLDEVAAEVCESGPAGPGLFHADEVETSVMLALDPGAVRTERPPACYPEVPATFGSTPVPFHRLTASGVLGDPGPATADKGARILDRLAERAVALAAAFAAEVSSQSVHRPPLEDGAGAP